MLNEYYVESTAVTALEWWIDDKKRADEALKAGRKVFYRESNPFRNAKWIPYSEKAEQIKNRIQKYYNDPNRIDFNTFLKIVKDHKKGKWNKKELASRYNIGYTCMMSLLAGRTYQHYWEKYNAEV